MFDYPIMLITDLIFYVKSIDVREERRKDSFKYHLWNYMNLLDPSSDDRKYLDGTHQTYLVKSAMKKNLSSKNSITIVMGLDSMWIQ